MPRQRSIVGVVLLALLVCAWLAWGRGGEIPVPSDAGSDVGQRMGQEVPTSAEPEGQRATEAPRRELPAGDSAGVDLATQEVRVQVLHAETREPVPFAEVVTWPASTEPPEWRDDESLGEALYRQNDPVAADAQGFAALEVVPDRAEIYAFADGLYGWQEFVPPLPETLVVVIAPDVALEGRVVDDSGRGLEDVWVEVVAARGEAAERDAFADRDHGSSGAEGWFRIPHLQQNLRGWEIDPSGRPKLRWQVEHVGVLHSGAVDWTRPLVVELPSTGYLDVDLLMQDAEQWSPGLSAYWIGADGQRIGFGAGAEEPADLRAEVPLGQEFEVVVERFREDRVTATLRGPVAPGESALHRIEVPWRFVHVRGRILDEAGEPVGRARVVLHPDEPLGEAALRSDGLGRFEESWWLVEGSGSLRLRRVEVTPDDQQAVTLQPDVALVPGRCDLGDLQVACEPLPLVARVRVTGLQDGDRVIGCEMVPPRSGVICRAVERGVFEVRGEVEPDAPMGFEITGVLFHGYGVLPPGETELTIPIARLGALDLEMLAPGDVAEDRLVAVLQAVDGEEREFWFEAVAPGTLRGSCELPPGRYSLELRDGGWPLHRIADLRIDAGERLALTGERALDLRQAWRRVVVEFVDPVGEPFACAGQWAVWGDRVDGNETSWFDGQRLQVHVLREVRALLFLPDEARPVLVPVTGGEQRAVVAPMQPVSIEVAVGSLPRGLESGLRIEIVGDTLGIPLGDPRREEFGIDLWERVADEEGSEYEDWYYPGTSLEVRVLLQSTRGGERMQAEIARQRIEVVVGQEQYGIPVDPARREAAVRALGR